MLKDKIEKKKQRKGWTSWWYGWNEEFLMIGLRMEIPNYMVKFLGASWLEGWNLSFLMEGLDFLVEVLKLRIPDNKVKNGDFLMTWLNLRFVMIWLNILVFLIVELTPVLFYGEVGVPNNIS